MNSRYLIKLACHILSCWGITLVLATEAYGQQTRLKDLVNIKGVRSNHLIGYGLVVGLPGTGDSVSSLSTNRSVANMLTRLGITSKSSEIVAGSAAAVIVNVELPSFARNGERIDARISSIGDATSLAGGTLLLTPLRAGDGKVYAVSQGAVVVGQADGAGPRVLTVASVPRGVTVEREFIPVLASGGTLDLNLKKRDFTTNSRIADAINGKLKGFFAESIDPVTVRVQIPPLYQSKLVAFISMIENIRVDVDQKAIVVLNERTGTVVFGGDIKISPVTITHGDLSIQVRGGKSDEAGGPPKRLVKVPGTSINSLVKSLNALGVRPADLIGIVQAMHSAGALRAELKFL